MDDDQSSPNVEEKVDETLTNQDVDPVEVKPEEQEELAGEMDESDSDSV